jgi:hypothetical protein
MINFRKLKKQIRMKGTEHVFLATREQVLGSDWQIWSLAEHSRRKLIRRLVSIIRNREMYYWRKEFMI